MDYLYRAFDGIIFEEEDDCLAHERLIETKDANIYFADAEGEQITLEEIITQSVSVDDIAFIKCGTYEDYEKLCSLFDDFGVQCPEDWWKGNKNPSEARCWYWDESTGYGGWSNLRKRLEELERLKNIYENVFNA